MIAVGAWLRPSAVPGLMASLAIALALPSVAAAHGAPPVSEQIVLRGAQLVVPTRNWGVFLGTDGGPWRWICEEAINRNQGRAWTITGDGTYHVTDYAGITTSRDGGCTWIAATGDIATRATAGVIADPVGPKRAWATTNAASDQPWNALFLTDDDGLRWTVASPQLDEFLKRPAVSSDGQTIYLVGSARSAMTPTLTLHVSRDGAHSWASLPLVFWIDGAPATALEPIAIDPADAGVLFLRARGAMSEALVKASGYGVILSQQFVLQGEIGEVAFDVQRQAVLAAVLPSATGHVDAGLMRSVAGGPFSAWSDLHQAQCVTPSGDRIYACSNNLAPDQRAIARSDDGGQHFVKVFEYAETLGPVQTCAAGTPVAQMCPVIWELYAAGLGVGAGGAADAGTGIDGPALPATGKSCSIGRGAGRERNSGAPAGFAPLLSAALAVALWLGGRRRRARLVRQGAAGTKARPSA